MLTNVPPGTHMCLIFSDKSSAMTEVAEFLAYAVKEEGHAQCFLAESSASQMLTEMGHCGCEHHDLNHRVEFSGAKDIYAPSGVFIKDRMLGVLKESYIKDSTKAKGPIHYTGEMEWALSPEIAGTDALIDYEYEANEVCAKYPFSAICQYDATMFSPEMLVEIMRVHPYMLVDGMIVPSPHFKA